MAKHQARFSQLPRAAVLDTTLTETDFRVLAVIGLYLNHDQEAWPMQSTVADALDKSQSTINRSIKRLEDNGYIRSRKKYENRPGTHRCYQVVFESADFGMGEFDDSEMGENAGIGKNAHSGNSPKERISGNSPKGCISHKNNPDEQPKGSNFSDLNFKVLLEGFWQSAPKASRQRSSKNDLAKALKTIPGSIDPEDVLKAWKKYLGSPDAVKEDGKFVPGIHRWIKSGKYDAWIEADKETGLFREEGQTDLERCFEAFGKYGTWHGGRFGFVHPHDARAEYDPDLYRRFDVKPRELV